MSSRTAKKRSRRPLRVYLDTNAVNNFFRGRVGSSRQLRRIRRALERKVGRNELAVLGSIDLIEELFGVVNRNPQRYRRLTRYLLRIIRHRLLLPTTMLIAREVRVGRRLLRKEKYCSRAVLGQVASLAMREPVARKLSDQVRGSNEAFERIFVETRRDALMRLDDQDVRDWWGNAGESTVTDWTLDYLRDSRDILKLPADETDWPAPIRIPTAWNQIAYYLGRIYLNVGEGRRIDGSDSYDARHYANACYADVLVTDDGRLKTTYEAIPARPFRLMNFQDFVAEQLAVAVP